MAICDNLTDEQKKFLRSLSTVDLGSVTVYVDTIPVYIDDVTSYVAVGSVDEHQYLFTSGEAVAVALVLISLARELEGK